MGRSFMAGSVVNRLPDVVSMRLEAGEFVDDGLANKHHFDIVLEGVDGGIHVGAITSSGS